jgi:hypothetical protein
VQGAWVRPARSFAFCIWDRRIQEKFPAFADFEAQGAFEFFNLGPVGSRAPDGPPRQGGG